MRKPQPTKAIATVRISPHIRRNVYFLKRLAKCRSAERCQHLLAQAGPEQLLCLVECCLNLLHGRLPIQKRHLQRLSAHAPVIRALSKVRSERQAQKHLLQTGAGVPALLPVIASALLPIILETVLKS